MGFVLAVHAAKTSQMRERLEFDLAKPARDGLQSPQRLERRSPANVRAIILALSFGHGLAACLAFARILDCMMCPRALQPAVELRVVGPLECLAILG